MIGKLFRRRGILSDREQELRAREAELLERLDRALARFGPDVDAADLQRFREVRDQLAGLFLLVIAGEFNSGKSSFINALLGEAALWAVGVLVGYGVAGTIIALAVSGFMAFLSYWKADKIALAVSRTMASADSLISGSGTSSKRISPMP